MLTRKKATVLLFVSLFLIFFVLLFPWKVRESMHDFEVGYRAGKRVAGGENLYRIEDGHFMYKYLPAAAILQLPFSLLPDGAAKFSFYVFIAFCTFCVFYVSYRLLPSSQGKSIFLPVLAFIVLGKFFVRELGLGQINIIITLLLLLMIRCLAAGESGKSVQGIPAGLLWALAVILKPYALIFLPFFIVKKAWKPLFSGLFFISLSFFAPILFYGLRGCMTLHRDWALTLSQSTQGLLGVEYNTSIIGFFMKWTGNRYWTFFLAGIVLACLALLFLAIVWKGYGIRQSTVLEGAVLLALIPLISPLGWDYTCLMSVLGVMLVLQHFFEYSIFWKTMLAANCILITFSVYDVLGSRLFLKYQFWSLTTLQFLIFIGYLAYIRFRKLC